jgi:hypothetical protein
MSAAFAIGLSLLTATVACGGHASAHHAPSTPVGVAEWHAVIVDVLEHGKVAHRHSCAATVVARAQISAVPATDPQIDSALNRYERSVCRFAADVWGVRIGMTDRQVTELAGAPVPWLSGPHCWVYKKNKPGTSIDGARYCFTDGRVSAVQTSVHG